MMGCLPRGDRCVHFRLNLHYMLLKKSVLVGTKDQGYRRIGNSYQAEWFGNIGFESHCPAGRNRQFSLFQQTKDLCITKLLRLSSSPKRKCPIDDINLSRIIREDYEGSIPHKSRWSVWSGILVEVLSLVAVGNMLQHMEKNTRIIR